MDAREKYFRKRFEAAGSIALDVLDRQISRGEFEVKSVKNTTAIYRMRTGEVTSTFGRQWRIYADSGNFAPVRSFLASLGIAANPIRSRAEDPVKNLADDARIAAEYADGIANRDQAARILAINADIENRLEALAYEIGHPEERKQLNLFEE